MGKRTEGKIKPKSIKSKAINKNSKRKLAVLGKKQKEGHAGEAIMFLSRSQALRKLSISLKDFRRVCILKGIYPRDPKKKPNKNMTYYHAKDISYIANEPIMNHFREMKTFLKRISRAHGRKEVSEAQRKWENMPEMSIDHLVKERYPTFISALTDMDDALSMIHLFSLLPAKNSIRAKKTLSCQRLVREWDLYVTKSKSLRKSFISIKGTYYQAEVMGERITWLVPHKFSQELPSDVDYKVMLTFLDFYEVFLGFVLFRLYGSLGLKYPPTISSDKDNKGSFLYSMSAEQLAVKDGGLTEEDKQEMANEAAKSDRNQAAMLEGMSLLSDHTVVADAITEEAEYQLEEEFAEDEDAKALLQKQKEFKQFTSLFQNLVFFISREVPRESVEFLILCFGGKIGWEGELSPYSYTDPSITHVVMDRPTVSQPIANREYVQPQWLFDSINNAFLLPVGKYAPGVVLPPHLSPFVDNDAEGYTPEYQKEIDRLKGVEEVEEVEEKEVNGEEESVMKFAKEIEKEAKGEEKDEKEEEKKEEKETISEEEESFDSDDELELSEEKERQLALASKRHKRLFEMMEKTANRKEKKISNLKKKAKKLNTGRIEKI